MLRITDGSNVRFVIHSAQIDARQHAFLAVIPDAIMLACGPSHVEEVAEGDVDFGGATADLTSMVAYRDYGFSDADAAHTMAYLLPALTHFAPDVPGLRILDVGCGNGFLADWFRRRGASAVVGVDLSESGIAAARKAYPQVRYELLAADENVLNNLGEPAFDLVVSTEVIEHLYDPRAFVRGCFAACKPGGHFICSTPYHGYLKYLMLSAMGKMDSHLTALWDGGHIKFWSERTIRKLLEETGFADFKFRGAGRLPYLWMSMVVRGTRPRDA